MNIIKNISILKLTDEQKEQLEQAALLHRSHSRLTFKIVSLQDEKVIIQVSQSKSPSENYFSKKRLIEIVHETFDRFFPEQKVLVHAIEFSQAPTQQIDAKWITNKMLFMQLKLKQISQELGVDYTQLSALVNGKRPLSQTAKAMFYYYFLSKKQ